MKKFQITIPEPCHENWNEMTPKDKGRHCQKCDRTIVDFSTKPDWEISESYKKNNGKLCGRFSPSQLERDMVIQSPFARGLRSKAASLFLGGSLLAASSVQGQEMLIQGEIVAPPQVEKTQGKVKLHQISSTVEQTEYTIRGIVKDKNGPVYFVDVYYNGRAIATDKKGYFEITINVQDHAKITFNSHRHESKTITLGKAQLEKNKPLSITLHEMEFQGLIMGLIAPTQRPKQKKEACETPILPEARIQHKKEKPALEPPNWIHKIYPNPFSNEIAVDIKSDKIDNAMRLELSDTHGRQILVKKISVFPGSTTITLGLKGNNLAVGSYFLSLYRGEEMLQTEILEKGK